MSLIDFIKTKLFLRQLILALVGFGLFFFIVFHSLRWITHHNQKIQVPDLTKKSLSEAERIIDDMDLRMVVQDSADFDPNFPRNSVIKHNPKAGDIVKSNRKIYITLNSSGYRVVTIPEFQGKTKRNVESTLKAIGFEISGKYVYVPDIGKDVVRGLMFNGKKLEAGDKLPKKSVLTLILGEGAPEEELHPGEESATEGIDPNL
jgi:eukaryotic-like serine/threonine-protein kinase